MRTEKDVEAYLLKLNRRFRAVDEQPGTYLLETIGSMPPVALRIEAPIVVMRVHIGDATDGQGAELFRKLLELNAKALIHSSYGLEGNRVVLSSALELENLDFNELQATLEEIDFALAEQVPQLVELRGDTKKPDHA